MTLCDKCGFERDGILCRDYCPEGPRPPAKPVWKVRQVEVDSGTIEVGTDGKDLSLSLHANDCQWTTLHFELTRTKAAELGMLLLAASGTTLHAKERS